MRRVLSQRGLTLLEVLVALVVLGLVAVAYVQVFHGSHALVASSREWSQAIAYAEDAMERTKLGSTQPSGPDTLPGGFRRQVTTHPWQPGLTLLTVTVFFPGEGRFDLHRLARGDAPRAGNTSPGAPGSLPW